MQSSWRRYGSRWRENERKGQNTGKPLGKTAKNGTAGWRPLILHMLDVAASADAILMTGSRNISGIACAVPVAGSSDRRAYSTGNRTLKTPVEKAFKGERKKTKSLPKDAADIALFGRMVANDHSLTVEAASKFSHALSVHKVDNEIDFFAALNLDMLADAEHLGSMTRKERQNVVRTFVEATAKAIPSARKNTMNGSTIPDYVLGVVREKGHPVQLINAFESPIRSTQGYAVEAIKRLNAEYADLKETWGIGGIAKATIEKSLRAQLDKKPDANTTEGKTVDGLEVISLNGFIDWMAQHVI